MHAKKYNFEIKEKSREIIYKFIRASFKHKNMNRFKVLCLPGEECLELDIYKELGIPMQNITCLERDQEVYLKIASKNTGCTVLNQSVEDYVRSFSGDQKFNIVSLDLCGIWRTYKEVIREMSEKKMFDDSFVLYTNFCGERDSEQDYLEDIDLYNYMKDLLHVDCRNVEGRDILQKGIFFNVNHPFILSDDYPVRDAKKAVDFIVKLKESKSYMVKDAFDLYSRTYGVLNLTASYLDFKYSAGLQDDDYIFCKFSRKGIESYKIQVDHFLPTLNKLRYLPKNRLFYEAIRHSSYKYVGDNGMSMLSDLFFFKGIDPKRQIKEFLNTEANDFLGLIAPLEKFNMIDFLEVERKTQVNYVALIKNNFLQLAEKDRHYLGSERDEQKKKSANLKKVLKYANNLEVLCQIESEIENITNIKFKDSAKKTFERQFNKLAKTERKAA